MIITQVISIVDSTTISAQLLQYRASRRYKHGPHPVFINPPSQPDQTGLDFFGSEFRTAMIICEFVSGHVPRGCMTYLVCREMS